MTEWTAELADQRVREMIENSPDGVPLGELLLAAGCRCGEKPLNDIAVSKVLFKIVSSDDEDVFGAAETTSFDFVPERQDRRDGPT